MAQDNGADGGRSPGVVIAGVEYVPVVLLIHTKHPDGSPALMKYIRDDDQIDLAGGEEFMVAFAPRSMVHRDAT